MIGVLKAMPQDYEAETSIILRTVSTPLPPNSFFYTNFEVKKAQFVPINLEFNFGGPWLPLSRYEREDVI